ncbi:MAG TPA: hypothetical protein VJ901_16110 [Thermoanaerobaculia bacterium]|nr:hypothetical protein [Thermoanaerobaculia bacterium]
MADARHDTFGMSHETSQHSFRLFADGGAIELRGDAAAAIQKHMREVTSDFSRGDFAKPLFVHGVMPDGAAHMKELGDAIAYKFEELPEGGRIRITTTNADALKAVHEFLRFQIKDHGTKDSGTIER